MTKCTCCSIVQLSGSRGKEYASSHLKKLKIDEVNWTVLIQCPQTHRYWKEFYKYPESHGGGIPEFIQISEEEAKREFGLPGK
ncbi:MAG: hypothetical protein IPJ69_00380 [Deltaproteobacteria bacterium]|nr:MAG: hypothetical protein IPJ69_00380 [Deltaproteobacteria bacterium]